MWNAISLVLVWTRVTVSISYDDNHYTTGTSCVSWWSFTEVRVTTSLLTSPGLFSVSFDDNPFMTIGINVTFKFHSFFNSQARSRYLSSFCFLSILLCGPQGQQSSKFFKFSFIVDYFKFCSSGWHWVTHLYLMCLCVSISRTDSGLCIYHLFVLLLLLLLIFSSNLETIQVRHAGHCWRSRDELICDVLLWTPTYDRAKAGRPARTYIQQLCEDTGCIPEDLPEAMNDREKWRERVRDIHASGTTLWWWWLLIYKRYIFIFRIIMLCTQNNVSNHGNNSSFICFSVKKERKNERKKERKKKFISLWDHNAYTGRNVAWLFCIMAYRTSWVILYHIQIKLCVKWTYNVHNERTFKEHRNLEIRKHVTTSCSGTKPFY